MRGFLDELSKHGSFKDIVHHPATQAIGYAALAGEGIHLLDDVSNKRLKGFYKSKVGKGIRKGTLGVGSAFLAAEAVSSLIDAFSKKRKKKAGKGPDVIIKVQAPARTMPRIRVGKVPKITPAGLGRLSRAIGFKR
jgi:hypothetical protein